MNKFYGVLTASVLLATTSFASASSLVSIARAADATSADGKTVSQYTATCRNDGKALIAKVEGSSKWCTSDQADAYCNRDKVKVAKKACAAL